MSGPAQLGTAVSAPTAPAAAATSPERTFDRSPRPSAVLLLLGALVAAFALVPLAFVAWQASTVSGSEAGRLLFRDQTLQLLGNTVRLVAASTALCAVLGTSAAWLVERTNLPARRLFAALLAAPLVVPAFVSSYGWVSLTPVVQGFAGAVVIVSLAYYPLVYLPVAAALRGMDPAFEETARALGLGPWRTFGRVVVPQLRPALLGGSLLVALHLLAEFGAFALLRFATFTTAIYEQYEVSYNGPAANMLASVLVVICLVLLVAETSVRGRARYARVGGGTARARRPQRLGRWTAPALAGVGLLLLLALGVPVGSLVYWLVVGTSTTFPLAGLAWAAAHSLGLGLAAALVTTALAMPVALLVVRHRRPVSILVERATYVAQSLPGIVIALALVFFAIRAARPIYQTYVLLVAAYAIMFLPMALIAVRAALAQSPGRLTEVARSLGVRPTVALWRVTVPLIAPGLGAGAALVFLSVVTELTATLLLAPIGTQTLATAVWSNTSSLSYGAAAPYAALMVIIAAPATYLLTRRRGPAETR